LENTREDESPGEPGRGPIDLNSGMVRIRVPVKEPAATDGESAEGEGDDEVAAVDDAADDDTAHAASSGEDSENEDAAASAEGDGGA